MKLNELIHKTRQEKQLSQDELAEAAGVSLRTIQRIEKGEVTPRPFTLRSILSVLDVSIDDLNEQTTSSPAAIDRIKFNRFILLNLLIFFLPILFLIPIYLFWRRQKWTDTKIRGLTVKVLSFQIIWTVISFILWFFIPVITAGEVGPILRLTYSVTTISGFILVLIIAYRPARKLKQLIPDLF
ncbi:MAG: helix-turn-helix transcriptional regulator [Bacteroidota bacterium]